MATKPTLAALDVGRGIGTKTSLSETLVQLGNLGPMSRFPLMALGQNTFTVKDNSARLVHLNILSIWRVEETIQTEKAEPNLNSKLGLSESPSIDLSLQEELDCAGQVADRCTNDTGDISTST